MRRLPPEIIAVALIVGTAALASLFAVLLSGSPARTAAVAPTSTPTRVRPTPIPAVIAGPLDGLPTARHLALRRPIAAVIDNFFPDARPQVGISRASVVYETVAEAGITRLLAIFLERNAPDVGPVRSARPYFVKWAAAYRPLFMHAGGSPDALRLLYRTHQLGNVEALLPRPQFHRAVARAAPHNLFGSTAGAYAIARKKGWSLLGHFPWLLHKSDAPAGRRGPGPSLRIDFSIPQVASPPQYVVTYQYDPHANAYLRLVDGVPALDGLTEQRLEPKNVVVLVTQIEPIIGDLQHRVNVRVIGRGRAIYLRNGFITFGHWSKKSRLDALHFWNNRGHGVAFNPGQTWIDVVPPGAVRIGG